MARTSPSLNETGMKHQAFNSLNTQFSNESNPTKRASRMQKALNWITGKSGPEIDECDEVLEYQTQGGEIKDGPNGFNSHNRFEQVNKSLEWKPLISLTPFFTFS